MDTKDKRIHELEELVKKLLARIEELERRLALNSKNSSKPPSSDGLSKKPAPKSLREKTGKKMGGQIGHVGDTLKQINNPDNTIEYDLEACITCGESLLEVPIAEIIERQEIDVVIEKKVIAHKAFVKTCKCGKKNTAPMPKHIKAPVQYGQNVRALAIYLANQFVPKERTAQFFQEICQISISDTTLMSYDAECAQNLTEFHKAVLVAIKQTDVGHFDETGLRVGGKTQWAHVSSTGQLTHYRISEKRGDIVNDFTGIAVHDHWKSYGNMVNAQHAFCNAHHLRELRALFEIDKEKWAKDMYSLLIEASRINNPTLEQIENISQHYDRILNSGLIFHLGLKPFGKTGRKKRAGHNLLLRLSKYKPETLRFLYDTRVPFTNNLAERDLRMVKLRQKVSGCFRTQEGVNNFAVTRSFISTLRKQDKNVFYNLSQAINGQIDVSSFLYS